MFSPISLPDFETRTGLKTSDFAGVWNEARHIVALREITTVLAVQAMPIGYLKQLLQSVRLAGDADARPYAGCTIKLVRMDPRSVRIGQTFVERKKYQAILERFGDFFSEFCVSRGISKMTASIVLGTTADGVASLAHYIPPIAEEHAGKPLCLDGIHRNFVVKNAGTTIETVVVSGVSANFPCEVREWSAIQVVETKPPKEERFFGLRPELFRDLKIIGIDG
jgi:hypothetical protein